MNGLKIRKLAAVVAGGALLGAAAAPMVSAAFTSDQVKNTVYDTGMSPVVNVVVGSTAAISDAVWAGNIARSVVEHAVITQTSDGSGGNGGSGNISVTDLSAVLSIGGSVTLTGGKTFNSNPLISNGSSNEYDQFIGKDPLAFLAEKTVSYKYNDSTTNIDVKEQIGVQLNAKFSTSSDVKDLMAQVDAGDVNYTLNLGAGFQMVDVTGSGGASADFTDDSDDNIRIPFFGKTFLVQKVDIDDSNQAIEVRLIEDKAKQTFVAGESFTMQGIGDYDGQTLTVTVVSIVATGPAAATFQAKFNVTDEAGNLIDTQTVSAGSFVTFEDSDGDDVVSGDVYIDTASVNTGTNEGTVDVLVGTASVRLRDGENYPYTEAADSENINGPYVVDLGQIASTARLTSIVVKNRSKSNINSPDTPSEEVIDATPSSVFDTDNPLFSKNDSLTSAGEDGTSSFTWLEGTGALGEGLFAVTFSGFKDGEESTYIQIGDNEVNFRDSSDSTHSIPMWFRVDEVGDSSTGLTSTNNSNGVSFSFDNGNKTLYYDLNMNSQDFNVADGTILNGVAVDLEPLGLTLQTDLGAIDINTAGPVNVVLGGVSYTTVAPTTNFTQVRLRADGFARFAKASLNSSTASTDFLSGASASASNPTGVSGFMTTAQLANVFFYDDANVTSSGLIAGIANGPRLTLSGDSFSAQYGFFVNESGTNINNRSGHKGMYFVLGGGMGGGTVNPNTTGAGQVIPTTSGLQKGKGLTFFGTDITENATVDSNYYLPQRDEFGFDPSSETVSIAFFGVDENGTTTNGTTTDFQYRAYIDARDDEIPELGGSSNKISAPTSDVNYGNQTVPAINSINFTLSTDTTSTSSLTDAWSDFGTKISIADGTTAEFWIPQNRPNIEFTVTGEGTSTTVEGGEEITVDEGETGTFNSGTEITVVKINYTAEIVGGGATSTVQTAGEPFTYTTPANLNGKAMVYSTASVPAGPKIIVGGPIVNALAQEVADMLNAPGDMVAGVYGTNIIVAGYTADDTGQAAQDLIDALDAI